MANEEHVAILKQGVKVWNVWREKNPEVRPDLSEANLSEANLIGADLSRAKLHRANLYRADLRGADLRRADFRASFLNEADLRGAKLRHANFRRSSLHSAKLLRVDFRCADLCGAKLFHADLYMASLDKANLRTADFSNAVLLYAHLTGANLTSADLRAANVIEAVLDNAVLTGAKLWETQRANWSIKGVVCERASWDEAGEEQTEYAPGEFERLFSDRTKVVLHYEGGIKPIEVATLPAVLAKLQEDHPGCILRLQSVQEAAGGATVTIVIDDPGKHDPAILQHELQEQGKRLQAMHRYALEQAKGRQEAERILGQVKDWVFTSFLKQIPAQASDAVGTTKYLTVLFLDLAGFSGMPEEERQTKLELLRGLALPFLRGGRGRYINTWGDAIIAGFESPNDGLSCACTLMKVLKAAELAVRIGMSRGEALVDYNPLTKRADIAGDSINEGARLEPMAQPGEVLISEELRFHTEIDEDLFSFDKVERPLHKDVGAKKKDDMLECYIVRLKPKAEPAA